MNLGNMASACQTSPSEAARPPFRPMMEQDPEPGEWKVTETTVMMKNLDHGLTQQLVLDDFKANGFEGTFDFFYLPAGTGKHINRGYGFVNFCSPGFARHFREFYEGRHLCADKSSRTDKLLKVTPATLQGFAANYAYYSSVMVQRGLRRETQDVRPLFFRAPREGEQVQLMTLEGARDASKEKRRRGRRNLIDVAAKEMQCEPVNSNRFCHQCGTPTAARFKYCSFCGNKL